MTRLRSHRTSRTGSYLLLLAVIACFAVGDAGIADAHSIAGASRPGRAQLRGFNVLQGTESGYVEVSLPRSASISITERSHASSGPNPDVGIDGDGRFVGFALVEDPYPEIRREGRFLMQGRFGNCAEEACSPKGDVTNVVQALNAVGKNLTLKAGDYRLYLIADGAPAEVTVRLHGLTGRATFRVPGLGVVDIQTPPTRLDISQAGRVWSAGSSFRGGQVGFSLSLLTVRAKDFQGMDLGFCQYNALHPPPDEAAYGPHCPTLVQFLGSGAEIHFDEKWNADEFQVLGSFGYNANDHTIGAPNLDGTHGLGAWASSGSEISSLSFQGLFLTIE